MMLLGIAEIKGVDQVREEHGADEMSMAAPHGSPVGRRCKCNEHATERTRQAICDPFIQIRTHHGT